MVSSSLQRVELTFKLHKLVGLLALHDVVDSKISISYGRTEIFKLLNLNREVAKVLWEDKKPASLNLKVLYDFLKFFVLLRRNIISFMNTLIQLMPPFLAMNDKVACINMFEVLVQARCEALLAIKLVSVEGWTFFNQTDVDDSLPLAVAQRSVLGPKGLLLYGVHIKIYNI